MSLASKKVAELREALEEKGLDTSGTKPILIARLEEALLKEKDGSSTPKSIKSRIMEQVANDGTKASTRSPARTPSTPTRRSRRLSEDFSEQDVTEKLKAIEAAKLDTPTKRRLSGMSRVVAETRQDTPTRVSRRLSGGAAELDTPTRLSKRVSGSVVEVDTPTKKRVSASTAEIKQDTPTKRRGGSAEFDCSDTPTKKRGVAAVESMSDTPTKVSRRLAGGVTDAKPDTPTRRSRRLSGGVATEEEGVASPLRTRSGRRVSAIGGVGRTVQKIIEEVEEEHSFVEEEREVKNEEEKKVAEQQQNIDNQSDMKIVNDEVHQDTDDKNNGKIETTAEIEEEKEEKQEGLVETDANDEEVKLCDKSIEEGKAEKIEVKKIEVEKAEEKDEYVEVETKSGADEESDEEKNYESEKDKEVMETEDFNIKSVDKHDTSNKIEESEKSDYDNKDSVGECGDDVAVKDTSKDSLLNNSNVAAETVIENDAAETDAACNKEEVDDDSAAHDVIANTNDQILMMKKELAARRVQQQGSMFVAALQVPRQKPKSGKFWKEGRNAFRSLKRDKGHRHTFEQRLKMKEEKLKNKELAQILIQRKNQKKEEMRKKTEENKAKKEENERKAEQYQRSGMGRSVWLEPCLGTKLAGLVSRGRGSGVLVGTRVDDTCHVLFVAETPLEEEEEEEGGGKKGKTEEDRKEASKGGAPPHIDVSWLSEHAKQVLRLLPGGLTVLGFFLASPDSFLTANDSKLRKLLRDTAALETSLSQEMVILQSALAAKVLDSKTSSFKSVDVRSATKAAQFSRVRGDLVLDLPLALDKEDQQLGEDVRPLEASFRNMVRDSIFVFNNKILRDDDIVGKEKEVTDKKRKGGRRGKEVEEEEEEDEEEKEEVVTVQLLAKEAVVEEVEVSECSLVRMKMAGKMSCRAYLPHGTKMSWARGAVAEDLVRSLTTRLRMHTESLVGEGEQEDKIVHEPPSLLSVCLRVTSLLLRRVFVAVPDTSVTVCDYLYPGEGVEDCLSNIREIFGWELEEDSMEDDVEIVASPREARPMSSEEAAKNGAVRRVLPLGYALTLGVGLLSVGLAWLSLGRGGGGDEEGGVSEGGDGKEI